MEIINDSQWINGLDSISYTIGQGSYQWAQNVVNRGGIIETRQGFAEIAAVAEAQGIGAEPRGCALVTISGVTWFLAAIDDKIYQLNLNAPGDGLVEIKGKNNVKLSFPVSPNRRAVHFEVCVQAQESIKKQPEGYNTKQITPKFVVIIQDGFSKPQYWDGTNAGTIDSLYPDTAANNTPIGLHMQWAGDRLWVAQGRKIRASNLLNPFQFTEELITASGGFFFLPDNATGMGVTHDYKQLLVFTHFTTSAFQVGLEDRVQWPSTQDFQRVIFPSIGCVSHRTVINMYGMTWWMSHEGLVGLDNALAAYQTTRLDIQDLNMIRSKESVNWTSGGGCAGSFNNFLFFSVPSASKWNQHTWVMDQAPINTLAGVAPPAWAANWTGIRPEQWVTGQIAGRQRCFCLSRDLTNTGHQATVWEAFIGQRMDVPKVGTTGVAKDIGCAFESRFYGLSPSQYAKLRWIELDVAEIVGDVRLQVYYCGRRTSYKRVIDTHLTATVDPGIEEVFSPHDAVKVFTPQYRTIRSVTDVHIDTEDDSEVQTPYIRNKDREFSVLVQWSGQMAVSGLRLAVDPEPDYLEGNTLVDEYLNRVITAEGEGGIGCKLPAPNAPTGRLQSTYLSPIKPRWVEFPAYDSAVPNGVFFVAELIPTPPPGAYPSNHFPIEVTFSTETLGASIYYTLNDSTPHGPPVPHGNLYSFTNKPDVAMNGILKAVGTHVNFRDSPLFVGRYLQARVDPVELNPPPGGFPPDAFADPNPPPLPESPVAAYNFNALTSGKITDFSGHGNHVTPSNCTLVAGKHGKALSCNGLSSYVNLGNPNHLKLTGSTTWMAWVNAAHDPSPWGNIINKTVPNVSGWQIKDNHDSGIQTFCITISSAASKFVNRYASIPRLLNTWYHVAAVYNAEAKHLDMVINGAIKNGQLDNNGVVANATVPAAMIDAPANVFIGKGGGSFNYFNGLIDDVRIYNRALSLEEIQADMNKGVDYLTQPVTGFPVYMTCDTAGAVIHWDIVPEGTPLPTVDQSYPVYDPAHPPRPYVNNFIVAKAFKQYYLPSYQYLSSGKYFAKPRCATPTCVPDGGDYPPEEYDPSKTIRMAGGTAGSKLRYTINSAAVLKDGTVANNPSFAEARKDDVLRVIAQKDGMSDSLTKTATYKAKVIKVATPSLTPPGQQTTGHSVTVRIQCSTENVTMSYTIQLIGETPSNLPSRTNGTLVSGNDTTITFGEQTLNHVGHRVLRVMAFRQDMTDSDVIEGFYEHTE